MESIIIMILFFSPSILTLIIFILLKYLQYKEKLNSLKLILILLGLQLLFTSGMIITVKITNYYDTKKFYSIIDPTGENDGVFQYNYLSEEEKAFVDYYFGDGGRNVGNIIFGIFCILNFMFFSILSIIMDFIRNIIKRKYNNTNYCK